jgi:8-oxo-dGTP pyrophosphatase MutT (NUDIX family)
MFEVSPERLMLTPEIEAEIAMLAPRYGAPRRIIAALSGAPFDPLILNDRIGEVCMVVRRPGGTLLTAIKTFYPPGAYRLMTGGVGHGEPIEAALLREVDEETGLEVAVRRFLAVIEYRLESEDQEPGTENRGSIGQNKEQRLALGASEGTKNTEHSADDELRNTQYAIPDTQHGYTFVTFAFLLDEIGGALGPRDPAERIESFREVAVAELPALAARLESVGAGFDPRIGGSWGDWGRFRAVVHRVVYEALAG